MKKIALIFLTFLLISMVNADAQGSGSFLVQQRAEKQTLRLTQELKLSKKQIPQIQILNEKYIELMIDTRKSGMDRTDMIFRMRELQVNKKKEIKPILTKKQFKKYRKNLNRRQNEMQNRQHRRSASGGRGKNF